MQLFPADVAVVHTPSELQAAITNGRRDIEIRSHLDLRSLPLQQNPIDAIRSQSNIRLAGTFSALAYLTWPTRSIRVRHRCRRAYTRMLACTYPLGLCPAESRDYSVAQCSPNTASTAARGPPAQGSECSGGLQERCPHIVYELCVM